MRTLLTCTGEDKEDIDYRWPGARSSALKLQAVLSQALRNEGEP